MKTRPVARVRRLSSISNAGVGKTGGASAKRTSRDPFWASDSTAFALCGTRHGSSRRGAGEKGSEFIGDASSHARAMPNISPLLAIAPVAKLTEATRGTSTKAKAIGISARAVQVAPCALDFKATPHAARCEETSPNPREDVVQPPCADVAPGAEAALASAAANAPSEGPTVRMRIMAHGSALSREEPRDARQRRSTRSGKADNSAGRASKIVRHRPTRASAQETKCQIANNSGDDLRQTSRHSAHYVVRGAQRLCKRGNSLPRNKYYIYLQSQKRLKIRLEPVCATQYYIFTINKSPASFREFPRRSEAYLAMCVRDLQTGASKRLDPDRLSPPPRIEST